MRLYAESKESENTSSEIELAEKKERSNTVVTAEEHHALGLICHHEGNSELACTHLEKAVLLDPINPIYLKDMADFYYTVLERPEAALDCYMKLLEITPSDKEVLTLSANISVSLNRIDQAIANYRTLLTLEPWRIDIQETIDKLSKKQSHDSDTIENMHQQAQSAMRNGQIEKAKTLLEDVLRAAPDHAIAHNDMGILKSDNGEWPEAKYHYEKAVALAPDNLICLKNLADFYLVAMDEVQKALQIYLKILKINSQDVETLLVAGTICERFQQFDSARIFYENILEIEPWHLEASEKLIALG